MTSITPLKAVIICGAMMVWPMFLVPTGMFDWAIEPVLNRTINLDHPALTEITTNGYRTALKYKFMAWTLIPAWGIYLAMFIWSTRMKS